MSTILKRAVVARALFTLVLAIAPLTAPYAQDPTTSVLSEAKTATTMEDLGRALDLYRQAAEAGSTDAAIQLARLHLEVGKGLEMDYVQARLTFSSIINPMRYVITYQLKYAVQPERLLLARCRRLG
jgi:hypothetical protein